MYNKESASLGFLGHTDTVDYSGNWNYEKFNLTKKDDKLYGLGVCDMKSGIAAMISAVSCIELENFKKGIKFYFTYDEEVGFSGIKDLLEYEKNFPQTIIIGEPTNNEVMVGSKGLIEYKISFKGIKTHSSTPDKGKSAIMSAISFINELSDFYETEIKSEKDTNFDIPYTTMNIGKISGGQSINSVPDYCEFLVDFRTLSKTSEEIIFNKIEFLKKKYDADVQIINKLSVFFNKSDLSSKTCNFITEASFLDCNRIILGAGPITAHEVDEHISESSLYMLVNQYIELINKFCK